MEAELLLTAVLIGFGFGNTFLCTVVALNTTMGRRGRTCLAFIGGRLVGVMLLGIVIALYGWYMEPDTRIMILIFALLSLAFGSIVILHPKGLTRFKLLKNCEVSGCGTCDSSHREEPGTPSSMIISRSHRGRSLPGKYHSCSTCSSLASCSLKPQSEVDGSRGLENPDLKIDHEYQGLEDPDLKIDHDYQGLDFHSIFLLGSVRGATPCIKIMILVPLILTLPFWESLILVAIYALSSSIYTVAGILLGSSLGATASNEWKPHLIRTSAMLMMGIGVYYLYKFWTFDCSGGL